MFAIFQFAEHYGTQRLMTSGLVISAIGQLICLTSATFPSLLIGRLVLNFGLNFFSPSTLSWIAFNFTHNVHVYTSIAEMSWSFSDLLGLIIASALLNLGWQVPFAFFACACLLLCVVCHFLLPVGAEKASLMARAKVRDLVAGVKGKLGSLRGPAAAGAAAPPSSGAEPGPAQAKGKSHGEAHGVVGNGTLGDVLIANLVMLRRLAKEPRMWCLSLIAICSNASSNLFYSTYGNLLKNEFDQTAAQVGVISIGIGIAE